MRLDLNEMQIDEELGLTPEDIKRDLKGAFKRIVIDGQHMADVLTDDYNQYQNVTGKSPEEAIKKIYLKELPGARMQYPNKDDVDIVGYLFSEKLYKAIRKRHERIQNAH